VDREFGVVTLLALVGWTLTLVLAGAWMQAWARAIAAERALVREQERWLSEGPVR
jgi:hypothetical protein